VLPGDLPADIQTILRARKAVRGTEHRRVCPVHGGDADLVVRRGTISLRRIRTSSAARGSLPFFSEIGGRARYGK
jgi:hypothetical protein